MPHALLDLDWISECYPAPPDDPFQSALAMRNLTALWRNFRDVGATHLVLSRVVESRAELDAYRAAVPGAQMTVVRLRAPVETLIRRIERRGTDTNLAWARERTRQLVAIMEAARVEDLLVETEGRSVEAIAEQILAHVGWLSGAPSSQHAP